MSSTPRRSGIRLPWSSGNADEPTDLAAAPAEPEGPAEAAALSAPAAEPEPEPAAPEPSIEGGASSEFLHELIAAMRQVVESSRDSSLAGLRTAVESATASLDASTVERQAAMRTRAEADIGTIGEWERAEIERSRAEAVARVEARRRTLDQELAEVAERRETDRAALQQVVDDHGRRLSAFMAELARIDDPAAFAAAARRMPPPPMVDDGVRPAPLPAPPAAPAQAAAPAQPAAPGEPAAPAQHDSPAEADTGSPFLARRLAELDERLAEQPPLSAAVAAGDAATTSILVRGLGSFGAITTFKQSLEQVDGVESVKLALGPGGEFVYSAQHLPGVDMIAAVRSVEADAEIERDGDTLRVKVARSR